jgi:hypothetical protein
VNFVLALATCVLAQPLAQDTATHARMTIYYIPFAVETYIPVTEKTIRESAHHTIELDSQEQIAALLAVLSERKGNSRFDRHFVRLLLVPQSPPAADILVDSEGQVLEGGNKSALTGAAFTSLTRMLSELSAGRSASGSPQSGPRHTKGRASRPAELSGRAVEALVVAVNAFAANTELSRAHRNLDNYDVTVTDLGATFEVLFSPRRALGEEPSLGGETSLGREVVYVLAKKDLRILERSYFK